MEVHTRSQNTVEHALLQKPLPKLAWKKWLWPIAFSAGLFAPNVYADTYEDNFDGGGYSYSNSTGTLTWSTSWIETGDDGVETTGNININTGAVEIQGNARSIERAFDVTAYVGSTGTNTIAYVINEDFNNDTLIVELSTDGGSNFSTLASHGNNSDGSYSQDITTQLASPASNTFVLRFRSQYNNANDDAFFDNVVITLTAPPPPSCTPSGSTAGVEYEDQFDCQEYNLTNGSVDWSSSPWTEVGDDADPTAGGIAIVDDSAAALDGLVYSLRLNTTDSIYRVVDLSNAAYETASLEFDYRCTSATDFTADVSIDGGVNWANLATFNGCINGAYLTTSSLDLDNYLENNTRLRFDVSSAGEVLIDNIEVNADTIAPCSNTITGTSVIEDQVECRAFSGDSSNGGSWATDWIEDGNESTDGAFRGQVLAVAEGSNYALLLRETSSDTTVTIEREVNLSAYSAANLTLDYKRGNLQAGESINIDASDDGGGSWTTVSTLSDGNDGTYQSTTLNIDSYVASNTRIRIVANFNSGSDSEFYFDDIQIDPSGSAPQQYYDDFRNVVYNGSYGNADWSTTSWIETDDDGSNTGGGILITGQQLQVRRNPGTNGQTSIEREIDLSQYSFATLSFTYQKDSLEADDFVILDISDDGGATWDTDIFTISGGNGGAGTDASPLASGNFTLDSYISDDTRIRFRTLDLNHDADTVLFDDVSIIATGQICQVPDSGLGTYADEFNCQAYNNHDGSLDWSNLWQEIGEADGALAGNVTIETDGLEALYAIKLNSPGSAASLGLSREANLSAYDAATFNFEYHGTLSGLENLEAQVSDDDGNTWTSLATYTTSEITGAYQAISLNIDNYLTSNSKIRFVADFTTGGSDVFIDDVYIATTPESCSQSTSVTDPNPFYLDEFDCRDFNTTNGTLSWAAESWIEVAETNGPRAGRMLVIADTYPNSGSPVTENYALALLAESNSSTPTARRGVDLSSLSSAFLDFDYRTDMKSTESVTIAVSEDGINWEDLVTIVGTDTEDDTYQTQSTLRIKNNFLLATSEIRIIANFNASSGSAFYIDNIKITDQGILPNPPRAEWRFDESSWNVAGDVKDSSGNDYHGLAKNSVPIAGKLCNAADLSTDSPADLIDVDYQAANGLDDFTFMFWALPQSIDPTGTDYATPFSVANDSVAAANEATFFWIDNTTAQFWFKGGNGGDTSLEETTSTLNEFTTWRHYTWTRSGTGTATETHCLYENGLLLGGTCTDEVTPAQLGSLVVEPGGFIIGQEQDSVGLVLEPTQDWQGYIDEFIVFESALSQAEIQSVVTNHNAGNGWDGAVRDCSVPIDLKLEYRFEDTSPTDPAGVLDETDNDHDGTAGTGSSQISNTATAAIPNSPGTCGYRDFDGTTNANVSWVDPGAAAIDLSSDFSLTAWVQPNFPGTDLGGTEYGVISKGDNYQLSLVSYDDGGTLRANMRLRWVDGNSTVHSFETTDLELETDGSSWYHITGIYSDDQYYLYVNGSLATGGSVTVVSGVAINDNSLEIGQISGANNFQGFIDEVRIYSGGLSPGEVATVAADNHGCVDGLTAVFRFDEADWGLGIDVLDFSGNGHDGVAFNSDPVQGFVCNAADLTADGIGDYLVLGEGALNGLTDFTVTFWGRSANTGTGVAMTGGSITVPQDFVVSFDNPTSLVPEISDADQLTATVTSISDYTWRFYAWTRNTSSSQQCLYEGTALDAPGAPLTVTCDSAGNDNTPLTVDAGGFVLGQLSGTQVGNDFDAANDWEGLIDELIIFNEVKSSADLEIIRDNHILGKNWDAAPADSARLCAPVEPDPLIEIRFDEQAWTGAGSVVDSQDFASNGIATNSQPVVGKVCNAADLSGTGITDYISLDSDALNGRGSFTLMFWGKPNSLFSGPTSVLSGANGSQPRELVMRFDDETTADPELFGVEILSDTLTPGDELNNSEWHHYTWRRNEDENCFYQDGVSLGCATGANTSLTSISPGGFILGQEQGSVGGSFTADGWDGLIDELIIFNQILSDAQILQIYGYQNVGNGWDNSARSCQDPVSHYEIDHAGSSGATVSSCGGVTFSVNAHQIDDSPAIPSAGTTITMSCTSVPDDGSCATMTWSLSLGNGIFTGPNQYTFSGNESTVDLHMDGLTANTTYNINITDGISTETTNNNEDPDLIIAAGSIKFYEGGYASGTADNIGTQVAYKPSNVEPGAQSLSMVALGSGGCALEPSFQDATQPVNMFYECVDSDTCSASGLVEITYPDTNSTTATAAIAGNDLGGTTSTPLNIYFDADAEAAISFVYKDAGKIRLYANDGTNGDNPSNNFVVRPFGFLIEAKDSLDATPTTPVTTDSTAFVEAGEAFKVDITAVGWEGLDDDSLFDGDDLDSLADGNDGHPDDDADLSDNSVLPNFGQETSPESVSISHSLSLPLGGSTGVLSGTTTFNSFNNGTDQNIDIEWNEVGGIELQASLVSSDYLLSTETVRGAEVEVGRFIPSKFTVTPGTLVTRSDLSCSPASDFTYMEENLSLSFTMEALNQDDAITENYDSDFALAHLDTADELGLVSGDDCSPTCTTDLTSRITSTPVIDWQAGQLSINASLSIDKASKYVEDGVNDADAGPYTSVQFGAIATEDSLPGGDSITASADYNMTTGGLGAVIINTLNTELRYGRLLLEPAYGPETHPLEIPLQTQYWDSTTKAFITNADDSCTPYDSASGLFGISTDSATGNMVGVTVNEEQPSSTTLFNEGQSLNAQLSDTFYLTLGTPAGSIDWTGQASSEGTINLTISAPSWLQYDWFDISDDPNNPGTPDDEYDDPKTIITFGTYRGHDRVIYWEEVQ